MSAKAKLCPLIHLAFATDEQIRDTFEAPNPFIKNRPVAPWEFLANGAMIRAQEYRHLANRASTPEKRRLLLDIGDGIAAFSFRCWDQALKAKTAAFDTGRELPK